MKRTWAEYDAEQEELRQREALRLFLERERQPVHLSGKALLKFLCWVVLWGCVGFAFVWLWLAR